jgi:hypothetical protein
VIGVPSFQRASGRMSKAIQLRSSGYSAVAAISPYETLCSSPEATKSDWWRSATDRAGTPRKGSRFSVSNVPWTEKVPGSDRVRVPPFGADGLTWGRCGKSGPRAGAPNSAIAWVLVVCAVAGAAIARATRKAVTRRIVNSPQQVAPRTSADRPFASTAEGGRVRARE